MKNRVDYIADKNPFTKDIDGLSKRMLDEHFKLYEGYVKKSNEIQAKLETADKSEANGVYSFIGELKREETFAVNGMKLHEVYFGHLQGDGDSSKAAGLIAMIERDFGGIEEWKAEVVATGMSARGWAVTAFDYRDNRLHVYGADGHNVGAVWGAIPIIVLDIYEHAYFIDYGTSRKAYIDSFFRNLDWGYAEQIARGYGILNKGKI